ncbi:40S ribosomal protein S21 [Perkinsus olseni]|uniref:40S ribosomal protein S21 n=1 Tax=Perkinsus olseni TaxID=32597 RepID=A0A7J6MFU2_PEROL|nr:40S ribosomal protein S21 [Perkinsus olseni]KAF4675924.1 40S ribosomal protein S21 [Perkinsus olseni]
MQNDQGKIVDLYIPRKCSATNRIIAANDHKSAQFNVAVVDLKTGLATGEFHPICIAGYMRGKGESDACVNRLLHEKNILTFAE